MLDLETGGLMCCCAKFLLVRLLFDGWYERGLLPSSCGGYLSDPTLFPLDFCMDVQSDLHRGKSAPDTLNDPHRADRKIIAYLRERPLRLF
jgi:hypothetical protein